jgi:uncharacterized membrane protein
VFVLLTQDGWSDIFYSYYRACSNWQAICYFVSLYIIGPIILLNLFLAILLKNFDEDSLKLHEDVDQSKKDDCKQEDNFSSKILSFWNSIKRLRYLRNCFKEHRRREKKDYN